MERSPATIFPNLPLPPRPGLGGKSPDVNAVIRWAEDNTRAVADLFRRHQTIVRTVPAYLTAAPSGGYSTTAALGSAPTLLKSDAVFEYPEALGTLADRTKKYTLTDEVSGATLTPSGAWTANVLRLSAPGCLYPLRIGKYGNLAIGVAVPDDYTLMRFDNQFYDTAIATPLAMSGNLYNTNVGTAGKIVQGINIFLKGECTTASANTTNIVIGSDMSLTGGHVTNDYFRGQVIGYRVYGMGIYSATPGTPVIGGTAFDTSAASTALTLFRSALGYYYGYRARGGVVLALGATLGTFAGFRCDGITGGTNRIGLDVGAITGGTLAAGVQVALHTGGTIRRSLTGGNSVECTQNDLIATSATKGLVLLDASTGNYWRVTISQDNLGNLVTANIGGLPAT